MQCGIKSYSLSSRLKFILLSACLVFASVALLPAESSKADLVGQLSKCQTRLLVCRQTILDSQAKIVGLQNSIDNLNQQLMDSTNKSEILINDLRTQLAKSKETLAMQQKDLTDQLVESMKLSKDLNRLSKELNLYRNGCIILGGISLGAGVYIFLHIASIIK